MTFFDHNLETKSAEAVTPDADVTAALAALTTDVEAKTAPVADLVKRIGAVEATVARAAHANDNNAENKSAGQQFVESDAFKSMNSREKGRASLDLKAITSANATVGAGRSAGTSLAPGMRVAGIVTPAERFLTIRDLVAPGTTDAASVEYIKETGYTNNAAPVAEGAAKPYSDLTFDLTTAPVRTIAHLFKASKQILEDAAGLASYIDVRATYGLKQVEENQLLLGPGTGQNIHGLIPQATVFDDLLRKVGDTKVDLIRRAILQVRKAEYRATGIVMSPDDWADIETLKDTTGGYVWSNPTINNGQNLWGLPVVDTTVLPEGEFLVGAFGIAAQVFDRWQARVEVSSENEDDFTKNLVSIRAEERIALAVYRPESFVHGTFAAE